MSAPYILGAAQTDFARHAGREGIGLFELMSEACTSAMANASLAPKDIETVHVGNFIGGLTSGQGQLGGLAIAIDPALAGRPSARHEAACASGSIAVSAAMAELEAGRYEVALVVGVEQLRHMGGKPAAEALGSAAWAGREGQDADYLWPSMFSQIAEEVASRFGLRDEHLQAWSAMMFDNAKTHALAQTRGWDIEPGMFGDPASNPSVEGRLRKLDCGRLTDGASALVLASPAFAKRWAAARSVALDGLARVSGWGHTTGTMLLDDKLAASRGERYLFPHVAQAATDARRRAGLSGFESVSAFEVHDCFSITGYLLVDHLGVTPPGRAHEAFETGALGRRGRAPMNPGGGLIGLGHPVGATGVRMLVDATKQVTGTAGDAQVPDARVVQTLNLGGSATTVLSFIVDTAQGRS